MAKANKEEPKALPTLFKVTHAVPQDKSQPTEYAVSPNDGGDSVAQFTKESEAGRLCDLLNGAYVLFKRGEKSQGVDKPTLVGKPKKK